MKVYEGVLRTDSHGSVRLYAISNLKLKRGSRVNIIPDNPRNIYSSSSIKLRTLVSNEDAIKLFTACHSEDHFGDLHIYEEGIIIGVIEACVLANLDLHDSSVTGIRNATFKLGIGASRQPTKRERIECGINRLKKVK